MQVLLNLVTVGTVGVFYVFGSVLSILSSIFLVTWIIDTRKNTNYSKTLFDFLMLFMPEKKAEKAKCACYENVSTKNHCDLCGRQLFKKTKTKTKEDVKIEKIEQLGLTILIFIISLIVFEINFFLGIGLLMISFIFWAIVDMTGLCQKKPSYLDA